MKQDQAILELSSRADVMRARGVASAYVFGSTVRGEARQDSDLDVFIDVSPGRKFSLIDLVGIRRYLEAELGTSMDLTKRGSLHPKLRDSIEREAVKAF